jgi:hypothetical protein
MNDYEHYRRLGQGHGAMRYVCVSMCQGDWDSMMPTQAWSMAPEIKTGVISK